MSPGPPEIQVSPMLSVAHLGPAQDRKCGLWPPHLTAVVFLEGIQLGQEKTMSHPQGSSLEVKLLYH